MVYLRESVKGIKIRVFKWTQNMIKNHVLDHNHQLESSSRFGFLVLRGENQIKIVKHTNCCSKNSGEQTKYNFKKSVQPFKICESSEELIESIELAFGLSELFFWDPIPHLANTIYDYLSSSFGKNLNFLSNMDDEFNKIVVAIDVNMQREEFDPLSNDIYLYKFQLTDLYETFVNDGDTKDKDDEFYLQVHGVHESYACGVNEKRIFDVPKILELKVEYTFNDSDIQEILYTLLDFLTKKGGFLNKVEVFDGVIIQEFRNVKSGLKIVKLEKESVVSFELGDICPVCFEILEEKSVAVVTPCSHMFHRSCIFTWLSQNTTCPLCRESCAI